MKKLIITADDYGMCESVNRAIEACSEAGVVLSTNVMANMEFAMDAAQFRKRFPNVSLGLHYNFTVGKPLSPASQVPSLVNENGEFLTYKEIRQKCKDRSYCLEEIKLEMGAQYERYVSICGEPDYWNTHENVHVHPWLYTFFCDISDDFGIKKMRTHRRIYIPASNGKPSMSFAWRLTEPVKQHMLTNWRNCCLRKGIAAPSGLLVRMNEEDKLNLPYSFAHIQWRNNTVGEMAIHPAMDANCQYFGEITDARIREYQVFSDTNVLKIAEQNGISIVGFEEVGL